MENDFSYNIERAPAWREMLQGSPCGGLSERDVNILNKAYRNRVAYVCQQCSLTMCSDIEQVEMRVADAVLSAARGYKTGIASVVTYLKAAMKNDNSVKHFQAQCRSAMELVSLDATTRDGDSGDERRLCPEPEDTSSWDPSQQADWNERQRRIGHEPTVAAVVSLLLKGVRKRDIPVRLGISDYRFRQAMCHLKRILTEG